MTVKSLVVATNNRHKLAELRSLFGAEWRISGASDVAPGLTWDETGDSFEANARIKIAALRPFTAGYILADDSGLCVDALKGKPGVHSSSFGGVEGDHPRNVRALLDAMRGVAEPLRTARFYCLLLLSDPTGREFKFEGTCEGRILRETSGEGGFGYDPVFLPDGFSVSMAAMSEDQKNKISHRGRAATALLEAVRSGRL
jgi:XTP/dITP diphosphohydrolase